MRKQSSPTVRRFEPGASGIPTSDLINSFGYKVVGCGRHSWRVVGPNGGRPKAMSRKEAFALLDKIRMSQGLQPIRKPDGK